MGIWYKRINGVRGFLPTTYAIYKDRSLVEIVVKKKQAEDLVAKLLEDEYKKWYDLMEEEKDEEAENYYRNILLKNYGIKEKCPHCNKYLLKSDLPEYNSVCLYCDENFYKFEEVS